MGGASVAAEKMIAMIIFPLNVESIAYFRGEYSPFSFLRTRNTSTC